MGPLSESRLAQVNPALSGKIHQLSLILSLDPQPIILIVSAGLRTWAEQDAEWQKGRNPDGSFIDPIHRTGVVTYARGGQSWHNFGCAVDCEPEFKDGTIDWNASHPQWKRMEAAGQSLGLVSGATWVRLVDAPHFQLVSPYPDAEPNDEARSIYSQEGPQAFWSTLA